MTLILHWLYVKNVNFLNSQTIFFSVSFPSQVVVENKLEKHSHRTIWGYPALFDPYWEINISPIQGHCTGWDSRLRRWRSSALVWFGVSLEFNKTLWEDSHKEGLWLAFGEVFERPGNWFSCLQRQEGLNYYKSQGVAFLYSLWIFKHSVQYRGWKTGPARREQGPCEYHPGSEFAKGTKNREVGRENVGANNLEAPRELVSHGPPVLMQVPTAVIWTAFSLFPWRPAKPLPTQVSRLEKMPLLPKSGWLYASLTQDQRGEPSP